MTRWRTARLTLVLIATAAAAEAQVAGTIPHAVRAPSGIFWIAATGIDHAADCALPSTREWICRGLGRDRSGILVVLDADGSVATLVVGPNGSNMAGPLMSWGRAIHVIGASDEELGDLQATAWKPARSAVRQRAQRFVPVDEPAIQVLRVSNMVFWITGREHDRDAFVRLDGGGIAAMRIPITSLAAGSPESPYDVAAGAPLSLSGRIEARHGESADGAEVELFEPLDRDTTADQRVEREPVIRRAATRAAPDGTFAFDRLEAGRYQISVRHPVFGRGAMLVSIPGAPATVRLVPPRRASGRVLRHGLPVAAARVRFVPDVGAWRVSVEPESHLVEETFTDPDGRFLLALPPDPAGSIQIVALDGTSMRVAAPSGSGGEELQLGDMVLPDARRVTVRLLDGGMCDLFAIGPLGALGLTLVQGRAVVNAHWLELPESGTWALNAECGGRSYSLDPLVITVPADGPEPIFEVYLAPSG